MTNIRPATIADAPAIARVSVDTWRSTYAGIALAEYLASLSYAERAACLRHHLETATEGDGFLFSGVHVEQPATWLTPIVGHAVYLPLLAH